MRRCFATLLLILGLLPRFAAGQTVVFDHIRQEHGLSNGTVTAIAQDRAGFLWFGTEDGLNRYSGEGFTSFTKVPSDSNALADGWITGIVVAHDGALWVSTLHGGLHRYDPATEGFAHFRHADGDARTLSSDRVNTVIETHDGAIWVGTVRGVDRLDPATGRVRHFALAADSTALANDVLALADAPDGRLWVGGRTSLWLLDPRTARLEPIADDAAPWFPVRAIHADRRGTVWVATENALVALDPTTHRVVRRFGPPTASHASPVGGRVMAIADAPDGALWIGSDYGITRLDPASGTFVHYSYDRADAHSLGGSIVRSALVDRGGVLWVGLESYGISRWAPSVARFAVLRHDPASSNTLSSGYVRGITRDRAGDLWIGTQYGGLNREDARTGRITAYRHRAGDPSSLPSDDVWAAYEDRRGVFWVGLQDGGFGTFDRRTGAFAHSPFSPRGAKVNIITEDRAGRLLVGCEGGGLIEVSADRRSARTYGATIGDVRVLGNNDVQTLLEDRTGALWIGGVDGLTRLDRGSGHVERYRGVPGHAGSLGTDFVTHVFEAHDGTIWVATKGAGLARWDRATDRFQTYGVGEGLPHPFVYGVLEDASGRLWMSTDAGLARLDPRTGAIARYDIGDGLQAREFNRRAFYRASDGTMYFGGTNGLNAFRPDDVAPPPPPPPVVIVAVRPAGHGDDAEGVDSAERATHIARATSSAAVRLRPDAPGFVVSYAALDFSAPEKVRYRYRLDGVDRGWVEAGARREASYASLAPGRYVFHVVAANPAGVWNRDGATVAIVVEAPWWATWWARVGALLLIAGGVVAGSQYRVRAVNRRNVWLAERVNEQTRDLTEAQARLHDALQRERAVARELVDVTGAVPGAVFQLHEPADGGRRTFVYVSEGVRTLAATVAGGAPPADASPLALATRLAASIHDADRDEVVRSLAASREALAPWHAEFRAVARDGRETWIETHARPARRDDGTTVWTGVATDATAARLAESRRAELEARVLRAQKAESLAVLAGGIAHDFNNLLVGVLANAELLREELADATPNPAGVDETVELIRQTALRASELTQQMLAYAGRGRLVVEPVNLSRVVPDMLALVRSAIPRAITIDVAAPDAPLWVEGDATQLRQVVMNLATNAAEAIGDGMGRDGAGRGAGRDGAGRMSVRVGVERAPRRELALRHAAEDMPAHGPYAVLRVTDDGCGMSADVVERIFDPFFTTKFTGRGLGLAALLGVVRAHHGGLRVESAPGRGSHFALYLPLLPAPASAPASAPANAPPDGPPVSAPPASALAHASTLALAAGVAQAAGADPMTRRVLVVDDEPAVLHVTERVVRRSGYDVVTAADGEGALALLAARGAEIDAVLIDMTMPGKSGLQTAAELRARGCAIPVVLMSGYSAEEIVRSDDASYVDAFLKKPFSVAEARAVLASALQMV